MFKIGLEKEYFCMDKETKEVILVPKDSDIPHDGCGWLVEFRSQPCGNIVDAVFSLKADQYRNEVELAKYGVMLGKNPVMKPTKQVRLASRRRFIKNKVKFNNLYGHTSHRNNMSEAVAAVHVSVTFSTEGKHGSTINQIFDYADFVRYMDKSFKDEIKESKRRPGFYELKDDGRFEYRSLPNNISMTKLMHVINNYNFKY